MKKHVVIVAGGKGERMNAEMPKQFLLLGGKPVLMHTVSAFYNYDKEMAIVVVLPEAQIESWQNLCKTHGFTVPHRIVTGGATRFHSVKNGLEAVNEADSLIAVHDGVRPFVSRSTIDRCFRLANERGSVVPVTAVVESLRFVDENGSSAVNRADYRLVQTPQVFRTRLLKQAYRQEFSPQFTDDASVIESFGEKVFLCEGNEENIKITTPFDLKMAEILLDGF
ncbi:MAG: 2-C-methyl-D-erythritol 4-phosphate cytidylyltransferase [Prevotellaceae bacterium]|jgi:2-C-methyl-D-erythritol 4-phosphate cytidylyltransferase|nr:2-C-methyl-D-erythritol 4-phosphate cytidylyltransferase [Prevotellaceae bacterium]